MARLKLRRCTPASRAKIPFPKWAASTPGGKAPLGVELNTSLALETRLGFHALAEYAALFPLAGLDNPAQGLTAKPAQLVRLRLAYLF